MGHQWEITQGLDHGDASSSFGIGHCQLCVTSNHGPSWAIMAIMGRCRVSFCCSVSVVTGMLVDDIWWQSSIRLPCFKREYTACIFVGPCCLESGRQFPISSWFGDFLPRTCANIDWLTILRLRLHQNRSCLELWGPSKGAYQRLQKSQVCWSEGDMIHIEIQVTSASFVHRFLQLQGSLGVWTSADTVTRGRQRGRERDIYI